MGTQLKKKSAPIAENIEMLEVFETEEMIDIPKKKQPKMTSTKILAF